MGKKNQYLLDTDQMNNNDVNQNSHTEQVPENIQYRKWHIGVCIGVGSIFCLFTILGGLCWLGNLLDDKEAVEEVIIDDESDAEEVAEITSINRNYDDEEYSIENIEEDMKEKSFDTQAEAPSNEDMFTDGYEQTDDIQATYESSDNTEQEKERILLNDQYIDTVSASSELADNLNTYHAEAMFDGNKDTCWAEGIDGNGEGECIEIHFLNPVYLTDIFLLNGYMKNEDVFNNNGKIKKIELGYSDGDSYEVSLNEYAYQDIEGQTYSDWISHDNPIYTEYLRITILDASAGEKYEDTCLSELELWGYVGNN